MSLFAILAAVVIGTWNGNWFPSGRAEHRAHPAVEDATITAAAEMLAEGIHAVDPERKHDLVLCLCEIRGPLVASNLVERIGRPGLRVVSVSGYRRRDRFDQQQNVIATTLPVVDAGWVRYADEGDETPPRGYAYATVVVCPAVTSRVYATHLKSNYGATRPEIARLNTAKRTHAIEQILRAEDDRAGEGSYAVVAGDMNADRWRSEFASERIFDLFQDAGYLNILQLLPPKCRGTHPSRTYGNSALDYIFVRKFDSKALPKILPNDNLSDHQALFAVVEPVVFASVEAQGK